MPVRASVLPQPTPGHAILRLTDLDAPANGLTLSIQRQQGPDSHLAEDGWRRTEAWLRPEQVVRIKGVLDFHLGPGICDRLAGVSTLRLRVKEPDIGVVGSTVVAWPFMLTSGAIDPTSQAGEDTGGFHFKNPRPPPPPAPPFESEPVEPPRPIPELRAARYPAPVPRGSGALGWLIAALILIVIGSAGYYAYITDFQGMKGYVDEKVAAVMPAHDQAQPPVTASEAASTPTPTPTPAEPPKKSVRDTVAEYLATKPAPEAMLAKARDYAQAGEMNGAFLVWRHAAESGNAQAELEVAGFYDPLSPQARAGFTPDAARAADWYERAALAGLPEAQRKYGLLLAKGGTGLPADPAKARTWLQQAAAQNDPDAQKALETLPK